MAREAIEAFAASMRKHGERLPEDVAAFPLELGDALDASVYRVKVDLREAAPVA
jgi:hypothetical protein